MGEVPMCNDEQQAGDMRGDSSDKEQPDGEDESRGSSGEED